MVSHFLATVSRDICKLSPIVFQEYLAGVCIVTLYKRHRPVWCMCLALWFRILVMANISYVVVGVFGLLSVPRRVMFFK